MENKQIDLSQSIFMITRLHPEVIEIMADLGFKDIRKNVIRNSVGKLMTIPKGARTRGIDLGEIIKALEDHGFTIINKENSGATAVHPTVTTNPSAKVTTPEHRTTTKPSEPKPRPSARPAFSLSSSKASPEQIRLLKSYLRRLGEGEDIETVRKDFKENFEEVEAADIMRAEQELIAEGEPIAKVQQLCDLHSALFHGSTKEERFANAEKEVAKSIQRQQEERHRQMQEKRWVAEAHDNIDAASQLIAVDGHPLQTFTYENKAMEVVLENAHKAADAGIDLGSFVAQARDIAIHYAKKGDLLYPLLKVKYEVSGPSQVMWTVDGEIRSELSYLANDAKHDDKWTGRAEAVLKRAEEMIYKENNILFPLCASYFTDEEWKGLYRDSKDYATCLGVKPNVWEEAEEEIDKPERSADGDNEVVLPGGHFTIPQLTALLNTIPMEITFVDADNINRFFNEGPKVFKRPMMAIDREVFSCHPPKVEPMVRGIIESFRSGKSCEVPVWMVKNGRTMLVRYMAVRDKGGNYLGTLEVVQDMEFAREHFLGK